MPLEMAPSLLDNATHSNLDREMQNILEKHLPSACDEWTDLHYAVLLSGIVAGSKDMDTKYRDTCMGIDFIKTHGEIREKLASAWRSKSYNEIRNLAILRTPNSHAQSDTFH